MSSKTAESLHIHLIIASSVAKHLILQILPGSSATLTQCFLNLVSVLLFATVLYFYPFIKKHLCRFIGMSSISDVQSEFFWQ